MSRPLSIEVLKCTLDSVLQILDNHKDEVWHVQFSHSGTMLASASKDTTALIWRVDSLGEPMLMHTLAGHEKAVAFLTWSPDDTRILTCGADNEVTITLHWIVSTLPEDK